MHVGILGGTFDPIHTGHLIVGETALEQGALDEVWFMPTYVPPHKKAAPLASAAQRWEMVCLAVQDHPRFKPCDVEIARGGTSYTIDTMQALLKMYPGHRFSYVIGGDMVQYLQHWHRIDELTKIISFIGVHRPGTVLETDELPTTIRAVVRMVLMPLVDISSTSIRERRRTGRSTRYLVPESVRQYMERAQLYE